MISEIEKYQLPFAGRWFVMHGGDTLKVNHHMAVSAQWYGIDFMKVGDPGSRALHNSNGKKVEDYYSWAEDVFAPISGKLEIVVDAVPDNRIGVQDKRNIAGNHVVIQTEAKKFVFIAHLQNGSVRVKRGDDVAAGQPIGKCGNSGNSSAPHIHLHTQDTPTLNKGTGQNMIFKGINVELTGKVFENVDWPLIRGLFVWNGRP
jgi:Peptidase family M23